MKKYGQYNYLKNLLAIVLVFSSIVGCQTLTREYKNITNVQEQVEAVEEDKSNLAQSLEKLNSKLNTFEEQKKAFILKLGNAVQYKDNKAELELVNSENLLQSLAELQSANNELSSQHLSELSENKIKLKPLHNSINETLKEIEAIIIPAKDGLTEKSLKKIQDKIFESPKKEPWYGKYGLSTKDKIVEILNKPNLKTQISDLTNTYSTASTAENITQPEEGVNKSSNSSSIEDRENNIHREKNNKV
ncbi:MAG: hypothetical protein HC930_08985 [Hydrococcus sp. SU_1_0]|nr:hypothetical protein [Hydrococcus sp. SU_1_0]